MTDELQVYRAGLITGVLIGLSAYILYRRYIQKPPSLWERVKHVFNPLF